MSLAPRPGATRAPVRLAPPALALILVLAVTPVTLSAQDPVAVSPDVYRVLLENEQVRVLEMTLAPGVEDNLHEHPSEVVYFLEPGKLQITLPDGNVIVKDVTRGETLYSDRWTHRVRNLGSAPVRAAIVELKR